VRKVFAVTALLTVAISASAHHSISRHYHRNQEVTIEGVLTNVTLRNPHSMLHMSVTNETGGSDEWALELDDAGELSELGITSETLLVGDELIVFGYLARDGSNSMFIERFERPADGLVYEDEHTCAADDERRRSALSGLCASRPCTCPMAREWPAMIGEAPLVEVEDLHKVYALPRESLFAAPHRVHALRGVSLTVRAGTNLGVVGESGCGKSTLARAVMGLELPARGAVRILGTDVTTLDRPAHRGLRRCSVSSICLRSYSSRLAR